MIRQGPFLAPSHHCQTVCLQKGVWTYSASYPSWRKTHHLFTQGSKKGHFQTSFPCKTRMCFCDWSSQDKFGPPRLFQFHTPYIRVLKPRRTWEHDSVRRDTVKTKAWRPRRWRASQECFLPQEQTVFLGLVLTHMEHKLMRRSITGKPVQKGSARQHLTLCRRRTKECLSPTANCLLGF